MPGLIQETKLFGENIPWLQGLREKGLAAFKRQGLPTAKTEAWKYTRPRDLNADDFIVEPSNFLAEIRAGLDEAGGCRHADGNCSCGGHFHKSGCSCGCHDCSAEQEKGCCQGHEADCGCPEHELDLRTELPFEAYQIHFVNGKFIPVHPALPRGVEIMTLMEAVLTDEAREYLGRLVDLEHYPFAALNTFYLEEGIYIRIARDVELDKPVVFINHSETGAENLFYNIRNLVVVEAGAAAEFVEYYKYGGDPKSRYFANIVNEIFVGHGAQLRHYKLQNDAFKAGHVALNVVRVKEDGRYDAFALQRGANLGRNETKVSLVGEKAGACVNAAYVMHGWATLDTTTDIEHLAPCTCSDQLVKGVIGGDAKGVFQGKIHIAPGAVKTEGSQLHKALLLTDTAEIDVKPELEIFADDVKCSHGAASGELDENMLFYMQSRGIGYEEARRILIDAYLEDVINKIGPEEIRGWFRGQVK